MSDIGNRIKQIRIDKNMSQEEFAKILGYKSRGKIANLELGKTEPEEEFLDLMCGKLHVSMKWIMTGEGDMYGDESRKARIADFVSETLKDKQVSSVTGETTYVLESKEIPSDLAIGPTKNSIRIGKLGTILSILESKWGFLILIVFPSLLAFLYELWEFIANIKAAKEDDDDEEEDDEDEDEEEKVVEKKAPVKNTTSTASKAKKTTTGTSQKTTTKKTTTTKSASTAKKTTTSKPKTTTKKTTKTKEQ